MTTCPDDHVLVRPDQVWRSVPCDRRIEDDPLCSFLS